MKLLKYLIILFIVYPLQNTTAQVTTTLDANVRDITDLNIGFNRRSDNGTWWTVTSFINLISEMNPDVVRYPAGTQANYWDWSTGQFIPNTDKDWGNKEVVTIPTFLNALPDRTKVIYVVNMARPTPITGIDVNAIEQVLKSDATLNLKIADMLNALDEFVLQGKEPYAVELGNEFYFGNIEAGIYKIEEDANTGLFYSGWDEANNQSYVSTTKAEANIKNAELYLKHCNAIVSAIKAEYPNIKFIITTTKNDFLVWRNWNDTIFDNLELNAEYSQLTNDIYAVTQHHYLNDNYGVQTPIYDVTTSKVAIAEGIQYPIDKQLDCDLVPSNYKIWITEFGEVKEIAEETWASAVRYIAFVYSWLNLGDKIDQLDWHYISDNNVVNDNNLPMKLAPVGIAVKQFMQASAEMTEMQQIHFSTNPVSLNGVLSLYGYKFKNAEKETLLIVNLNDIDLQNVIFDNLFTYTGAPTMSQYYSTSPWVTGVSEGDPNIQFDNSAVTTSFDAKGFSITVIEAQNTTLNVENFVADKVQIYPNPIENIINIKTNQKLNAVSVYNLTGALVFQPKTVSETINIEQLQTGMYVLKIETEQGEIFKKIIKN